MHSIGVKSEFNYEINNGKFNVWIDVVWTVKTTYCFKLCYPDGIEYDVPRSHHSINQFILLIDEKCPIFLEHWLWMIDSVKENYHYAIMLTSQKQNFIDWLNSEQITFQVDSYLILYRHHEFSDKQDFILIHWLRTDEYNPPHRIYDFFPKQKIFDLLTMLEF